MSSQISAIHYCIPKQRLTNEELSTRFEEKQIRSITKMSGIRERRVVSSGVTASDLAFQAAHRLLAERAIDPATIDLLIFASQTSDYQIPATACVLHGRLGLDQHCAAFDINLGCTSFPYTLGVAHGMLTAGISRRALLLNADALTTVIHPRDRGLVPLHGDGAVATLLEPGPVGVGIEHLLLGTDGSGFNHLIIPASGARTPRSAATKEEMVDESGVVRTSEHLYMNGPAIFHFSIYKVPEIIKEALDQRGLSVDDLDLVLLHQANKTMIDQIYRVLNVPQEKRFYFMEDVGNMSGASTPALLAEAYRQGRILPGSRTLLASFGVGLSWGVVILRWPDVLPPVITASVEMEE